MKMYRVILTRKMTITVNVNAEGEDAAENDAIEIAEAVGYTNLSLAATVYLERETTVGEIDEI